LKILDCERKHTSQKKVCENEPIKPNKKYDLTDCYLCGKELKGASKKGVIKNRNNPAFWGINCVYKVICLDCLGKKYYKKMENWQRKK
jgi:hypothetical protein